uniref:Uncharacterized protein n=1 Tax=Glossina brevipalpis TaxID=37001 RepID=A0A1A9X4F8_9MUSC
MYKDLYDGNAEMASCAIYYLIIIPVWSWSEEHCDTNHLLGSSQKVILPKASSFSLNALHVYTFTKNLTKMPATHIHIHIHIHMMTSASASPNIPNAIEINKQMKTQRKPI